MSTSVLRDLRDLRVQVVHPPDDQGKSLVEHLRRIGCTVEANWPVPDSPTPNADVLMIAIDYEAHSTIRRQAMAKRLSLEEMATAIINANELLTTKSRAT